MVDAEKFTVFQERHAMLSFHVAAMMVAAMRMQEAEHMVALGQLGNAGAARTEFDYHKAKVKALVQTL
jgi:hypothetical protein